MHPKNIVLILIVLCLPAPSLGFFQQTQCSDVAERGYLNVLTLNLLYSDFKNRENRFQIIVDFIEQRAQQEDPIDIILLQEVVGGFLSGTENSSHDLKQLLVDKDINYNLIYVPVNNQLGILTEGIAILSRCKILFTLAKTFKPAWENPSEGLDIPLRRKVIMGRLHIPGVGNLNVFNTHLCAFCDPENRSIMIAELLDFLVKVDKLIWWRKDPAIVGGDFNIDRETQEGQEFYEDILNIGFDDTYAVANDCESCCSAEEGYQGCTYSVSGNPYTNDPPVRIDYIFTRDVQVLESTTLFTSDPDWASDHSGVLSKISIP